MMGEANALSLHAPRNLPFYNHILPPNATDSAQENDARMAPSRADEGPTLQR
jgi:hypothetical protein